jgi:hypothetical protein
MKTSSAILFLVLFVAANCHSPPAVPEKRRLMLGITPAQKELFVKVLKAGMELVRGCAIAELEKYLPSILKGMGIDAHGIVNAIIKFIIHAVETLVGKGRRRTNVLNKIGGGLQAIGGAMVKGARNAGHGIAVVGSSMKSFAKKLNSMTGGALEKALADLGCPALMVAIKAGIAAAFPGIIIPGCVSKWFTGKCKDTVKSAFKRARLLRRLTAIRREIQKF